MGLILANRASTALRGMLNQRRCVFGRNPQLVVRLTRGCSPRYFGAVPGEAREGVARRAGLVLVLRTRTDYMNDRISSEHTFGFYYSRAVIRREVISFPQRRSGSPHFGQNTSGSCHGESAQRPWCKLHGQGPRAEARAARRLPPMTCNAPSGRTATAVDAVTLATT
jgi:hypothetical protein